MEHGEHCFRYPRIVMSDKPVTDKPTADGEILELYKLHAELTDRVSQRREAANRLFVGLLTGVWVFLAAFARFGAGKIPLWLVLVGGGVLGIALSIAWFVVIRSYRQLNSGKFAALGELESRLAFPFFRREWEILERGENTKKYWKLTVVETFLPLIFSLFFLAAIVAAYFTHGE